MKRLLTLVVLAPLAGCAGTASTPAGDAVQCAASLAAAYTAGTPSGVLVGCAGLASDVLAQLTAKAKVAAAQARQHTRDPGFSAYCAANPHVGTCP